jgi:hypothetical protein
MEEAIRKEQAKKHDISSIIYRIQQAFIINYHYLKKKELGVKR